MYYIRKILALFSIVGALLSTIFCPFLKVFLAGSWNLYKVDTSLFFITNGILLILLLLVISNKAKLFRFTSVLFVLWCLLAVVAVFFKTNNFFGMKFADGLIAKSISFQWGWPVLILFSVLIVFSSSKVKTTLNEK